MANKCKDCGCTCKRCISSDHDVQLYLEIENLKQRLLEKENHIVMMETNFLNEANKYPNGELAALREELITWQDKYKRLYEAHRRVQRVNQGLEDKLLKLVDVCEHEKTTLTKDVATLSQKLAEANYAIKKLTEDNERYKSDVSLAIQFLQCKQSNFVAHRFDSLTPEVQSQVSNYMTVKKKPEERKITPEMKSIKVPIPTFPPTAMVYSVPKSPNPERKLSESDVENPSVDIVSAAIMAKVLEERQRERSLVKHCDTCTCARNLKIVYDNTHHSVGTQTGESKSKLCIHCNDTLQAANSGVTIVRNPEPRTQKVVPIYPLETLETPPSAQTTNNIVKVQPNNFLLDSKSKTNSANSSPVITNKPNSLTKTDLANPNNHVINNEIITYQTVSIAQVQDNIKHHKLSEKITVEKSDPEKVVEDTSANNAFDNTKGPRYCSMRVQTGTRNILLDNAQEITPVLYTRTNKLKREETVQSHNSSNTGSDCIMNSLISENSAQNQQRVAEWIQNNLEDDISSSENSRSENLKSDAVLDKAKYAEMEENVRRFLFGESEFLKTVELGKLKYQNLRDGDKNPKGGTETDI